MGRLPAIVKDTKDERRLKFEQAVESQHALAVRTAESLRKIRLLDSTEHRKTELDDFKDGQVDPQLQLVLIARDQFLAADDTVGRLGFFKTMRDVFLNVDSKTAAVLKMAMDERHHREKLDAFERKANLVEPSDAEVDAALEEDK